MIKGANILVTGGAGFIGSALCRNIIQQTNNNLIILDKLTYASNMNALDEIINEKNVYFYKGSIGNITFVEEILLKHTPKYVFNLAAETHVDNSITNPSTFVKGVALSCGATSFFVSAVFLVCVWCAPPGKPFKTVSGIFVELCTQFPAAA